MYETFIVCKSLAAVLVYALQEIPGRKFLVAISLFCRLLTLKQGWGETLS